MLSLTKSRHTGKKFFATCFLLFTVFSTYTVVAQEFVSPREGYEVSIPEKIHKLVLDPLPAGTYSIGSGGYFPTIDSAFNKLEADGVSGSVTLELTDVLYTAPTDMFGFSLNGPIPGAGPNSRVTIKPAENKNVLIQGSGRAQLTAINTSYVTIDGVSLTGPTTLTFHAFFNNQFNYNACIEFYDNSDHNIFRNIIFISDDINGFGGGPGIFTRTGVYEVPDSNLIENNFIKKAGAGAIFVSGEHSALLATGNIVRGNFVGSETDSLIGWGIQIEHCQNAIVENNIVQNLKVTPAISEVINVGINSWRGNGVIIRNNVVHGIKSNAGYMSVGILLSGAGGTNSQIYNNMIYDIQSSSTSFDSRVSGIQMFYQSNPKVYYNTVYLSGTGANKSGSAALYIYGGITNADVKNNIFVNTRDEGQYCASAIYDYSASNLTSDYNDLYYDDTNNNNCLVRISSTNYFTLADWQATGKDLNSINEMPNFIDPFLHIDTTIVTMLNAHATPIAGIETDIDGQGRNILTPDIGADEFDIISGVEDEETLPTEFALEQNYPNPFNPGTTIRYSIPTQSKAVIKVFDILGNEIATLVDEYKPAGKYEIEFDGNTLPSGVYFYQLKAVDPSTGSGQGFIQTRKMLLLK